MTTDIKVGIIGGTGLGNPGILENRTEKIVTTQYGDPSDVLVCGTIEGTSCVLLPRHGRRHKLSPTNVNYRANILALKNEGCTHILSSTASGSLKEEIEPGNFVVLDQFIDRTYKRAVTFYDQKPGSFKGVCHVPMSHPFCKHMRSILIQACRLNAVPFHPSGTIVTIEGPRFSTFAESNMFRSWGGDLVNMTTVPEATLAKEVGLLYGSLAMATDYDCWKQTDKDVNVENVFATFDKNAEIAAKILKTAVKLIDEQKDWKAQIDEAKDIMAKATIS